MGVHLMPEYILVPGALLVGYVVGVLTRWADDHRLTERLHAIAEALREDES